MKKTISILLSVVIMAFMASCSNNDKESSIVEKTAQPEPKVVVESVMSELKLEEFESCEEEYLIYLYSDIDVSKLESFEVVYEASGGYADEIGVFKMKSADDVKYMEGILKVRVKSRTEAFAGYAPDEVTKLEKSVVTSNGNYVFLCIATDSEKAEEIFEVSMKID